MSKLNLALVVLTSIAPVAVAAGCEGDKEQEPEPATTEKAEPVEPSEPVKAPPPPPGAATPDKTITPDANGVVHLTGNDKMQYNANRIEVTGTKVTIELEHIGKMPKNAMGHNVVILKPGIDHMAFAVQGATAMENDYIPEDAADEMIAHSKLLGGGESHTIEFEVPGPGEYPYVCTYPGHAALMHGTLVVKPAD